MLQKDFLNVSLTAVLIVKVLNTRQHDTQNTQKASHHPYCDDNHKSRKSLFFKYGIYWFDRNIQRVYPKDNDFLDKNNLFLKDYQRFIKRIFIKIIFRTKLLIELKIDGYAIALRYRNGKLEKSINREGRDVPNKIIKVQDIPKQLAI